MKCARCKSENYELENGKLTPKPISICKVCGFIHSPKESDLKKGDKYNSEITVLKMKREIPTVVKINGRRYIYDPAGIKNA